MAKGPICVTTTAQKSGEGVPMFSRPGKATIAEYIAFKEPHGEYLEKLPDIPEEVLKDQLKADLRGEQVDKLKQYKENQFKEKNNQPQNEEKVEYDEFGDVIKKKVRAPPPQPQGQTGNGSMFRSVPRTLLDQRVDKQNIAPKATQYSPSYNYIHVDPKKNYNFGDKGESETIRKLNEHRSKGESAHVCSKGVTRCFQSVKRVKQLSKKYHDETFKKRVMQTSASDASLTQEDANNTYQEPKKIPSVFYANNDDRQRKIGKSAPRNLNRDLGLSKNCIIDLNMRDEVQQIQTIQIKGDRAARIQSMRTLQEVNDNLQKLLDRKKHIESIAHPDPGRNVKRQFSNTMHDINISMTNFDKTSARIPFFEQMHLNVNENRFEPFNYFPKAASKYEHTGVPDFSKYAYRAKPRADLQNANNAQVIVDPNKEYPLRSLTLGNVNFDLMLDRSQREKRMKAGTDDKNVRSPNIYTHHDNAMSMMKNLKMAAGGTRLSPNLRFDNSPARDNKMYEISDLSNLNQFKKFPDNNLDRYLELENILPHQNTLARGYQKGSHYDYIANGSIAESSKTNFHSQRLSDNKVAKIMGETFTKLNRGEYVSSGPTKFDALRSRSKTIVPTDMNSTLNRNSGLETEQSIDHEHSVAAQSDYFALRDITQNDLDSIQDNKYIMKIGNINSQNDFAEKMEVLKLTHMQSVSPSYPLGEHFRAKSEAPVDEGQSSHSTNFGTSMAIMNSLKKNDDARSLFSEQQLSTLTLEQKMLAGLFVPKKRRDPSAVNNLI